MLNPFDAVVEPVLVIRKSDVVELAVDEAISKRTVGTVGSIAVPGVVCIANFAHGVEVPSPSLLAEVYERVEDEVMFVPLKKLRPLVTWVEAFVPPLATGRTPVK